MLLEARVYDETVDAWVPFPFPSQSGNLHRGPTPPPSTSALWADTTTDQLKYFKPETSEWTVVSS